MTEPARQGMLHAQTITEGGKTFTRLTMCVDSVPVAWMGFDIKQLDGLITVLQERLEEMVQLQRPRN